VQPVDLGAHVLRALQERTGFDPAHVDDVIFGLRVAERRSSRGTWPQCRSGGGVAGVGTGYDPGSPVRLIAAGHPLSPPRTVLAGQADLVVGGGCEVMSRVPMGSSAQDAKPYGSLMVRERYKNDDGFAPRRRSRSARASGPR
jgi:acetyl-CoA acyltransferase